MLRVAQFHFIITTYRSNLADFKVRYKMTKIYKAYVYEKDDDFHRKYFFGEIDGINIRTNIVELADTPIEFFADSKKELLVEMVSFLKRTGKTGVLRVVN